MKNEKFSIASELIRRVGIRKEQAGCGTVGPSVAALIALVGSIASFYVAVEADSLNDNERIAIGVGGEVFSLALGIVGGCFTHYYCKIRNSCNLRKFFTDHESLETLIKDQLMKIATDNKDQISEEEFDYYFEKGKEIAIKTDKIPELLEAITEELQLAVTEKTSLLNP